MVHSNHACFTYRTQAELVSAASAFLVIGLQKGERCWYVAKGPEVTALRAAMRATGVALDAAERQGALKIFLPHQIYESVHPFTAERVMSLFSDGISDALREGFTGFRAAGEMSWANHPQFLPQLLEYEYLITTLLVNSQATGLCLFDADIGRIDAIVAAHPLVAQLDGMLAANSRFERTYPIRAKF